MAKDGAHIRYKKKDGTIVPGVTTVLGVLAKPALIHWAWKLGTEGKDYRKVRDDKADIGTGTHYMILCHLRGAEPDLSDYTKNQIDAMENAMLSFLEWEKQHPHTPVMVETPLVDEEYEYGGTPDLVTQINGGIDLIDFKTGKGIYDEMVYQLAAYKHLVENTKDITIARCRILRIGRDESEGFEEKVCTNVSKEWLIFEDCLSIYTTKKMIKDERKEVRNDRNGTKKGRGDSTDRERR